MPELRVASMDFFKERDGGDSRLNLGSFPEEAPAEEEDGCEEDFAESARSEVESLDSSASDDNEENFHEAQNDGVMYQVPMAGSRSRPHAEQRASETEMKIRCGFDPCQEAQARPMSP